MTCLCDRRGQEEEGGRLERAAGTSQCLMASVHSPESISSVLNMADFFLFFI